MRNIPLKSLVLMNEYRLKWPILGCFLSAFWTTNLRRRSFLCTVPHRVCNDELFLRHRLIKHENAGGEHRY